MGVLGGAKIEENLTRIFGETGNPDSIRAAKYYLTLGDKLLVLPNGTRVWEKGKLPWHRRDIILNPGDTALVSTKERLSMPLELAGIFGPTFALSNHGIFFFGGMFVDPGFGRDLDGNVGPNDPLPLTFYLANVGADSLQLKPGREHIASISFLPVIGEAKPSARRNRESSVRQRSPSDRMREERDEIFLSDEPPGRALGLVGEVSELGSDVDKLKNSVNQVVLFGVILLATTLVAVISTLIADNADKHSFKIDTWLELSLVVASVIGEIAAVVVIFFLLAHSAIKILSSRRRRRRPGLNRN